MPLAAGTTLGPYEIVAPIGAGGMGEVYRARDPRLARDVAIKVLPAAWEADPDRMRRFELEARAAGSINHPNILAIYDIGVDRGAHYLVSELLEGETLQNLGAVPARKAVDYVQQAARGLAAAHAKDIVHRDIKPANLFLTTDGRVKILDFGLAKVTVRRDEAETRTSLDEAETNPGTILGSVAYMSPEQVVAKPLDHRSDLFSLGVVLFELLTGKRPFAGDSSVELMNAILKDDPPEVAPPALDRVVRHALEKQPEQRFQSAQDFGFALEAAMGTSAASAALPAVKPRARWNWAWAAVGVVSVLAIGEGVLLMRHADESRPVFKRLGVRAEALGRTAWLTPNGDVALDLNGEIAITHAGGLGSRLIGVKGRLLSVSSTGELAILNGEVLSRVPLSGGAPREVAEKVTEADWSPDGKEFAVIRHKGNRNVIEYPIDKPIYESSNRLGWLRVSPNGKDVAFFEYDQQYRSLNVMHGGRKVVLSSRLVLAAGLAWHPSGKEIWFSAARTGFDFPVYAATLDGNERLVLRIPGRVYVQDIGRDGTLLARHSFGRNEMTFHADGKPDRDLGWLDYPQVAALSPGGDKILFTEIGEAAQGKQIYFRSTSGTPAVNLGEGTASSFTKDGKYAVALSSGTVSGILLLPMGTGQTRAVDFPGLTITAAVFQPAAQRIVAVGHPEGKGQRVYAQDLRSGETRAISDEFEPGSYGVAGSGLVNMISGPGDSRVAITTGVGDGILIVEGDAVFPIPGSGGYRVAGWCADGKSIWVFKVGSGIGRMDIKTGAITGMRESPIKDATHLYVSEDGQAMVGGYLNNLSDEFLITGLK